jgi:hypothetical protein
MAAQESRRIGPFMSPRFATLLRIEIDGYARVIKAGNMKAE